MNKLALALVLLIAAAFPALASAAEEGEGPSPVAELTFSPGPLDFGKTTVGTETTMVAVNVHNAGLIGLPIDQVKIDGPDAGEFKSNGSSCGWLEAGGDCTAWVAFAPGSAGAKTASLVVQPKEMPAVTAPLTGTGVSPQLAFTPGSHDFGIQRVNRGEGSAQLQLANVGEAMTQLSSIGFGGKNTNNFWTSGGDCWNGRQLQPGESCNVQVGFNPWDTVAYEAELQAYVNGGTFSAQLTGFGGRAQVEPDSMPTELGTVTVGALGPVETVVFANHGNLPGNFFIGIVAGGDAGSFRLLDESCSLAPLAPGATCTAHVRFTPQSSGPKLARLALFGDDDGGTMAVLSGEGVAPVVTLAPDAFDFGALAAGDRGTARAFLVRNDGKATLDLDSTTLTGADPDQFLLAGDECSDNRLAPGAECLVRVRFAPDGAGAKAATLRVRGAAGGFSAALTGTGLAAEHDSPEADAGGGSSAAKVAPRPDHSRLRHRRFHRGAAVVTGVRGRALRRADLKARTLPR
jgi:hypothetical protein